MAIPIRVASRSLQKHHLVHRTEVFGSKHVEIDSAGKMRSIEVDTVSADLLFLVDKSLDFPSKYVEYFQFYFAD